MFDNSDPRKALTSMSKERSFSGPFCGPEVDNFSQEPPQQTGDGWQAWMMRCTNLVVRLVRLEGTATFARAGQLDEYMVFSTDADVLFDIETTAGTVSDHPGNHLFVVPPGDSTVTVRGSGQVSFLYTTRAADLVAECANPEIAANPNIPPFQSWPDPVGPSIAASQAVMDHYPASIRPGFLDGLWLHLAERMDLLQAVQIRTAVAYQNEGRIGEAAATLQSLRATQSVPTEEMTPVWLAQLNDRNAIALALARLRCLVEDHAPGPDIDRQLAALESNPKSTLRETVALKIWRAHLAHKRRDTAGARSQLQAALLSASRLGCFGVLSEQRIFLAPLLREARIRQHLETAPDIRATLSKYAASISTPKAKARAGGLTEREAQLLQLIAGGYPNKRISQALNIAQPTVKFHLSRLYAKLGAKKRSEAIQAANALGWL